jgi:hypothetical protein
MVAHSGCRGPREEGARAGSVAEGGPPEAASVAFVDRLERESQDERRREGEGRRRVRRSATAGCSSRAEERADGPADWRGYRARSAEERADARGHFREWALREGVAAGLLVGEGDADFGAQGMEAAQGIA